MREPTAGHATATSQKAVQLQTLARRRRRVWLNVAVILLTTLIMGVLSVAERDSQSLRGSVQRCHHDLEYARGVLQAEFDAGRPAPAMLPLPETAAPPGLTPAQREEFEQRQVDLRLRYIYLIGHRTQAQAGRPALVCQDVQMHDLYMSADQLHVIMFDGRSYQLQTLHREDLARMNGARGWTPPK